MTAEQTGRNSPSVLVGACHYYSVHIVQGERWYALTKQYYEARGLKLNQRERAPWWHGWLNPFHHQWRERRAIAHARWILRHLRVMDERLVLADPVLFEYAGQQVSYPLTGRCVRHHVVVRISEEVFRAIPERYLKKATRPHFLTFPVATAATDTSSAASSPAAIEPVGA